MPPVSKAASPRATRHQSSFTTCRPADSSSRDLYHLPIVHRHRDRGHARSTVRRDVLSGRRRFTTRRVATLDGRPPQRPARKAAEHADVNWARSDSSRHGVLLRTAPTERPRAESNRRLSDDDRWAPVRIPSPDAIVAPRRGDLQNQPNGPDRPGAKRREASSPRGAGSVSTAQSPDLRRTLANGCHANRANRRRQYSHNVQHLGTALAAPTGAATTGM